MKIFLVTGESFTVPGRLMKPFPTRELANIEAARMVNILLEEVDMNGNARPGNWEPPLLDARQERAAQLGLKDARYLSTDDDGHVGITEVDMPDVENNDAEDAARWRALMASDRIWVMNEDGFKFGPDGSVQPGQRGQLHIGIKFWDKYPVKDAGHTQAQSRAVLTAYVDHIRSAK